MLKSELIIWRVETRELIKEKHPNFKDEEVENYLDSLYDLAFAEPINRGKLLVALDALHYLNRNV